MKKIILPILLASVFVAASCSSRAFAQSQAVQYLNELGATYYKMGKFDDALQEFEKVLLIEPGNPTAQKYVSAIFRRDTEIDISERQKAPEEMKLSRLSKVSGTLNRMEKRLQAPVDEGVPEEKKSKQLGPFSVKGEMQVSAGIDERDFIWKQANADLNEKNYRLLSDRAYDRRTNTFDARVFDRVKVELDTEYEQGFNAHSNIVVDPWSFVGKGPKTTISSDFGDTAEVELKYWSNTRYLVNEKVLSDRFGNSLNIPEVKVYNGEVQAFTVPGAFTPNDTFRIPDTKIDMEFKPIREFWVDYTQPGTKFRVFPIAYQDQALSTSDPLALSNNHMYWQQSPWLDSWRPGKLNYGATPVDFTKGKFDDSLSYFTRDSDGTRLTSLRGASLEMSPLEGVNFATTFATPLTLWQDYDDFNNLISASRMTYRMLENFSIGGLFTYRVGLNQDNDRDYTNAVWGYDAAYEPVEGVQAKMEIAGSQTGRDKTNDDYKTESRGNAYMVSVMGTYPQRPLMDLKFGYNELKPEEDQDVFAKAKLFAAHMDQGFDPALSNYRETRDDTFWSRHIHFRKPFQFYYEGLSSPSLSWDDISPYRIGDGIDVGRDSIGLRVETVLPQSRLENLFDVRNVHEANGKFIENVIRDELTFGLTDKLTAKLLGIYHKLPKTTGGVDPFIFDTATGEYLANAAIQDEMSPTLKTGSAGLEYAFTEWAAISGVWERTNDSTLGTDNFPRGVLNSSSMTTFSEYDRNYRREYPFLYSQGFYPLPPYDYFDIFKTGLRLSPMETMEIYLDYTRNEFKGAGMIDDNMNHIGLEVAYMPTKKLGLLFKYTYSRWNDVNRLLDGHDKIYMGFHNFFSELRYLPWQDDELVLQYGEGGRSPIASVTFDPFGGSLSTLETQHIFRMYYRRKF